mmetsp:Transcript_41675/g.61176  ORF Transcript_41675/g.61176 Transcript_41675/m.61176 type:complete len:206 (-) Transcript_41675:1613-2230(-)
MHRLSLITLSTQSLPILTSILILLLGNLNRSLILKSHLRRFPRSRMTPCQTSLPLLRLTFLPLPPLNLSLTHSGIVHIDVLHGSITILILSSCPTPPPTSLGTRPLEQFGGINSILIQMLLNILLIPRTSIMHIPRPTPNRTWHIRFIHPPTSIDLLHGPGSILPLSNRLYRSHLLLIQITLHFLSHRGCLLLRDQLILFGFERL